MRITSRYTVKQEYRMKFRIPNKVCRHYTYFPVLKVMCFLILLQPSEWTYRPANLGLFDKFFLAFLSNRSRLAWSSLAVSERHAGHRKPLKIIIQLA